MLNNAEILLQSDDDSGLDLGSLITASLGTGTYSISVSKYAFFRKMAELSLALVIATCSLYLEVSLV
jgi:hypothetical protein